MAGRIISIEIGVMTTYVTELDYKVKTPKVYQAFQVSTPDEVLVDGSVAVVPQFIGTLKAELEKRNIKTKKVLFVMNSARIANREVTIPAVKDNKIHELLISNSAEFFPVDLQQYQLVHKVIERNKTEKKIKLSILAVPNEIITSYHSLANALGLELAALDYLGNSVSQGMLQMIPDTVKVSIKVDELTSFLTIMNGDRVELQRNISYGIKEAVDTVVDSKIFGEHLSYEEGMNVMRRKTCMFRHLNDDKFMDTETDTEIDAVKLQVLREDVTENIRALVGNISRILDYYMSRNQEVAITQIWLIGPGADCSGLSKLLTNELNVKVKPIQKLDDVNFSKNIDFNNANVAEYAAPIAAAFNPLEFMLQPLGEEKKAAQKEKKELLVPGIFCGTLVAVAACMAAYALITSTWLKQDHRRLEERVASLQEAQTVYDAYLAVKADYDDVLMMYGMTETSDDALLMFLMEMQERMPSDIIVTGLNAGPEGVTMNLTVPSKPAAAKVLMQLRTFSTLSYVTTQGITEESSDDGVSAVTFTVSCGYAGKQNDETEEQEQDVQEPDSDETSVDTMVDDIESLQNTETAGEGEES